MEYTKQIGSILKPLVPEEYSDNPMLNILLADKKQTAESIGFRFVVKVESTGLGFIEPVDVTTLFGNLLENAMQAVLKCSGAWRNTGAVSSIKMGTGNFTVM